MLDRATELTARDSQIVSLLNGRASAFETPCRIFVQEFADEAFEWVAGACTRISTGRGIRLRAAYSVKTNPRREMLNAAHRAGLSAEVISPDEIAWARRCGFSGDRLIVNGPHRPQSIAGGPALVAFADSVEAFGYNARDSIGRIHGIRVRPPGIESRFGIAVEDLERLTAPVLRLDEDAELGASFHVRHEDYGGASWRSIVGSVIDFASTLQERTGRPVVVFDAGGSWEPAMLVQAFEGDFPWLLDTLQRRLPGVQSAYIEPGQSIATPVELLVATVVEVRDRRSHREVIVDAGYPELSQMRSYKHRIFGRAGDSWRVLDDGADRIGGRTCLEYDLLSSDVELPAGITEGDLLAVADCGSYDESMAFAFAEGAFR